jgi:hypothetical protein
MYFTGLKDEYAVLEQMTRRNWVCLASSADGGNTWTDQGIVLGQNNGIDGTGAWSPSALALDDKIYLYYHTGSADCSSEVCDDPDTMPPRILRSRFD